MKLAHLILAHKDPEHIGRLANILAEYSDVYIHIDCSANEELFRKAVGEAANIRFIPGGGYRKRCWWGGAEVIGAEIELLRAAMQLKEYDRLVLLQGADYPLKSGKEIISFFEKNRKAEFIHCTPCSGSDDPYFYKRCRCYYFYDNPNYFKRAWNKFITRFPVPVRDGFIHERDKKLKVYWGSALWAITGACANYIIDFYDSHKKVVQWFRHAFPADELFFNTIVMNSSFAENTFYNNTESVKGLVNLRNLHFFEYPTVIKVFTIADLPMLQRQEDLYIRKVNTQESTELLNAIDDLHKGTNHGNRE